VGTLEVVGTIEPSAAGVDEPAAPAASALPNVVTPDPSAAAAGSSAPGVAESPVAASEAPVGHESTVDVGVEEVVALVSVGIPPLDVVASPPFLAESAPPRPPSRANTTARTVSASTTRNGTHGNPFFPAGGVSAEAADTGALVLVVVLVVVR